MLTCHGVLHPRRFAAEPPFDFRELDALPGLGHHGAGPLIVIPEEFGILRQNEPMVVVTTVVSLVLYTFA